MDTLWPAGAPARTRLWPPTSSTDYCRRPAPSAPWTRAPSATSVRVHGTDSRVPAVVSALSGMGGLNGYRNPTLHAGVEQAVAEDLVVLEGPAGADGDAGAGVVGDVGGDA